jgi:hypothetical protein
MAITLTEVPLLGNPDVTERNTYALFSLTLSGNYGGGATHGDTVSFVNFSDFGSDQIPSWVDIWEQPAAGAAPSFYLGIYCPGTTRDNGVTNFSLNGTEFTQGSAYSGALATAKFFALVCFPTFV